MEFFVRAGRSRLTGPVRREAEACLPLCLTGPGLPPGGFGAANLIIQTALIDSYGYGVALGSVAFMAAVDEAGDRLVVAECGIT